MPYFILEIFAIGKTERLGYSHGHMEALMLLQSFIDGMIRRDVVSLVSLLHEDFLYLEDASLETRDEWIESVKKNP